MTETCCELHITGPAGTCCDEDDCGPCCANCPTCPTLHNAVKAGPAYGRSRNERGNTSVVVSVVVTILLCALIKIVSKGAVDPVGWLTTAIDWTASMILNIVHGLTHSLPTRR